MNILLMNSARTWGGTEKWTRMAAETLAADHQVFLAYRREIVGSRFRIEKYRLPCLSHIDLYTLVLLVRIIREKGIEIIIPTKRKDYLLAGLAAKLCGITNILRLGIERRLRIPIIHRLIYATLADGVIVNAETIKQTLLLSPFMQKDKIRVIYNGVDIEALKRLSQPPAVKPYPFTITTAGVLTDRKGHEFLIRGFARFVTHAPEIAAGLVIMGDGPKKDYLQNLAKSLGISDRVQFTGFLDNPWRYMASSDVFAMTSKNEGIPNALLEAMYLENVPVSTPAGGTEELIRHNENGFLVPYGDEDALANILSLLARTPEYRRVIANAAQNSVIKNFTLEIMRQHIVNFGNILKNRNTIMPD